MPRNGDGASDNGPIEGHEIIHGASGDKTLQHTKHVAPMPQPEEGDALPGMNASGGAAAPLNDASEEYGASAPRNEKFGDKDQTSTSASKTSGSSSSKSGSSNTTKSSNDKKDLAGRYVNMNEEDVQHAGSENKSSNDAERSSQRAPKDVGAQEDVEQLHGKATLAGNDKAKTDKGGKQGSGSEHSGKNGEGKQDNDKSGKQGGGSGSGSGSGSGNKGSEHEGQELESSMRHNAEKFVNLED